MASERRASICSNFTPNVFKKDKCQHCFYGKKEHLQDETATTESVVKEGFLTKAPDLTSKGVFSKKWKRRWFVLSSDGDLSYYEDQKAKKALGAIRLASCTEVTDAEAEVRRFNCIGLHTPARIYYVEAETKEEIEEWFKAFTPFLTKARSRVETGETILRKDSQSGATFATERERTMTIVSKVNVEAMKGWLKKQGAGNKGFKDRWFVMEGGRLSYFKDDKTATPQGIIDLLQCTGAKEIDSKKGYEFQIMTVDRIFICNSDTQSLRQKWVTAITSCVASLKRAGETTAQFSPTEISEVKEEPAYESVQATSPISDETDVQVPISDQPSEERQPLETVEDTYSQKEDSTVVAREELPVEDKKQEEGDVIDTWNLDLDIVNSKPEIDDELEALMEAEVSALTNQLKTVKQRLTEAEEKLLKQSASKEQMDEEITSLKKDLLSSESESEKLRSQLQKLSEEKNTAISLLQNVEETLHSQTSEWSSGRTLLEESLQEATSRQGQLEKLLDEKQAEIEKKEETLKGGAERAVEEVTSVYEDKMRKLEDLHDEEVKRLSKEKEDLEFSSNAAEKSAEKRAAQIEREFSDQIAGLLKNFEDEKKELKATHEKAVNHAEKNWRTKYEDEQTKWKEMIEGLKEEKMEAVKALESRVALSEVSSASTDEESESIRKKLTEMERESLQLRDLCSSERKRNESSESMVKVLEVKNQEVSLELEAAQKEKAALQEEIEALRSVQERSLAQIQKETEAKQEQHLKEVESAKTESEELTGSNKSLRAENEITREKLKKAEDELQNMTTKVTSLESALEELEQQMKEKEQANQSLEARASKIELEHCSLQQSYERLERSKNVDDELKHQLDDAQQRLAGLSRANEEIETKAADLEKFLSTRDDEITLLKQQQKDFSAAAESQIQAMRKGSEESSIKLKESEAKALQLTKEKEQLEDKQTAQEKSKDTEILRLKTLVANLEKEVKSADKSLAQRRKEKTALEAKLGLLEEDHKDELLRQRQEQQKQMKNSSASEAKESRLEVEKLKKSLQEVQLHRDSLLSQMSDFQRKEENSSSGQRAKSSSFDVLDKSVAVPLAKPSTTLAAEVKPNLLRSRSASVKLNELRNKDKEKRMSLTVGKQLSSVEDKDRLSSIQGDSRPPPKPPKPDMRTRTMSVKRQQTTRKKSAIMKLLGFSTPD